MRLFISSTVFASFLKKKISTGSVITMLWAIWTIIGVLTARVLSLDVHQAVQNELALLEPQSTCQYEAVQALLPECSVELDSDLRRFYAIELSKCEFNYAHVGYPDSCDSADLARCTVELESKATWWTTYSGNYRAVNAICNEYRQGYEARNIVQYYRKACDVQQKLANYLNVALSQIDLTTLYSNVTMHAFNGLSSEFENLGTTIGHLVSVLHTTMDTMQQRIDSLATTLSNVESRLDSQVEKFSETVAVVTLQLDEVMYQLNHASNGLQLINVTSNALANDQLAVQGSLKAAQSHMASLSGLLESSHDVSQHTLSLQTRAFQVGSACLRMLCGTVVGSLAVFAYHHGWYLVMCLTGLLSCLMWMFNPFLLLMAITVVITSAILMQKKQVGIKNREKCNKLCVF